MSAKSRLLPANGSRRRLKEWALEAAALGSDKSWRVLDAGAGDAPYRDLFDHVSYETADHAASGRAYGELDYICDLADMPMADDTYDLVFCSQVLEHHPHPGAAIAEMGRVLKPGGTIWASAPLFYEEHEKPYDFFRYTQFGWRRMAEDAGLEATEVRRLEGYYETVAYQCAMAARNLPGKLSLFPRLVFLVLAHYYSRKEQKKKITNVGLSKNYRVIMTKPVS